MEGSAAEAREKIKQYLIMERIYPPEVPAYMVKQGKLIESLSTLQELGIYSSMFINSKETGENNLIEHETFGKLLRTKSSDSDEGGVVAGYSVVDQPFVTAEIGPLTEGIKIKGLLDL
jgi:glutathione synthase